MPIGLLELWLFGLVVLMAYFITVEIFHVRRFSLRTLLIIVTALAITIGLAAAFIRGAFSTP